MSFGLSPFATLPFGAQSESSPVYQDATGVAAGASSASAVSSNGANAHAGTGSAAGSATATGVSVNNWFGVSSGSAAVRAFYRPVPSGRCAAKGVANAASMAVVLRQPNVNGAALAQGVGVAAGDPAGRVSASSSAVAISAIVVEKGAVGVAPGLTQAHGTGVSLAGGAGSAMGVGGAVGASTSIGSTGGRCSASCDAGGMGRGVTPTHGWSTGAAIVRSYKVCGGIADVTAFTTMVGIVSCRKDARVYVRR